MRIHAIAAALALASPLVAQLPALQVDWYQNPTTGTWYGADWTPRTWTDSRAFAESNGWQLATIRTQAEQDWLYGNVEPYLSLPDGLWIGLSDQALEGTWTWVSGSTSPYRNWMTGQPDDGQPNHDYARLADNGEWTDDPNYLGPRALLETANTTKPRKGWSWPRVKQLGNDNYKGCFGDFDGDGDLDYASPVPGTTTVYLFENDGEGHLRDALPMGTEISPYSVAAIDADGDGADELAVAAYVGNKISLYSINLTSAPHSVFLKDIDAGVGFISIMAADFNNDGAQDLAAASGSNAPRVVAYYGDGQGGFSGREVVDSSPANVITHLHHGDFNGDGLIDLVSATSDSPSEITIHTNHGNGSWSTQLISVGDTPFQPAVSDIDQDGDLDIMVPCLAANIVEVLLNNGLGAFTVSAPIGTTSKPHDVTLADLTGDGAVDLVTTHYTAAGVIEVREGNGQGSFGSPQAFYGAPWPNFSAVADLNDDGAMDLLHGYVGGIRYWHNGQSADCDNDGMPDGEEIDCDANGLPDSCEITGDPTLDQDLNGILDACEATEPVFVRYGPTGRLFTAIGPETWLDARAFGVQNDLYLATVEDEQLGTWLRQTFDLPEYWIGYNDAAVEGQFEWSSLRDVSYENWAPGAPNDFLPDQDFTAVDGSTGLWDTHFANSTFPAIMETMSTDCDGNLILDDEEIAADPLLDLDGDGQLDTCVSPNYCVGGINSTGMPGVMGVSGTPFLTDNDLTLEATQLPPGQWSYFVMSASQAYVPGFGGSQGNLCVGPPIVRFNLTAGPGGQIAQTSSAGTRNYTLDFANLPQQTVFHPGETWNFQLWFRDQNPGLTSNTTDGISVMFR